MRNLENRTGILFSLLLVCSFSGASGILPAETRIRGSNREYSQGDWITYSSTRFVRQIAIGDRFVYFATTGGIARFNFFSERWEYPWTQSNGLAEDDVYLVAMDFNTGYLWCVTASALCYLEPASQWWTNLYFDEMGLGRGEVIHSIGFAANGRVYAVSDRRRWLSSLNTSIQFNTVSLNENSGQIIWYGDRAPAPGELPYFFMSDGYLFDASRRIINDLQLREFEITCWVRDSWQNVWIGSWGLGAGRGDLTTTRLELLKYGLWSESVQAVVPDGRSLWSGGSGDAVTEWQIPDGEPSYFEPALITGFSRQPVTAIAVDDATVWFGTRDGLTRFDRRKRIWRTLTIANNLADNWVHDIFIDEQTIWVATEAGVSRIAKSTVGTDSLSIRHLNYPALGSVTVFDIDQELNLLWLATEYGIYVYDKEKDEGGFTTGFEGPSNLFTTALSCHDGEVWFGSEDGVRAFDTKTKQWLKPPARWVDPDNKINILRMLAAADAVWLGTDSGVYKYDRYGMRWLHFTREDGLPSNRVNCLLLDGDYLWFGTDAGLTKFYWNAPYRLD